jgi:hypothetical protein
MKVRLGFAFGLVILCAPIVFLGLIDPLEGGLALLIAFSLGIAVRLLSRVRVPRLLWIALSATALLGATVLVLAILRSPETQRAEGDSMVINPMLPTAIILVWIYRVGVIVTLVGTVMYISRIAKTLRVA